MSVFSGMTITVSSENFSDLIDNNDGSRAGADWDNAMHFYYRHRHTEKISNTSFQTAAEKNYVADRYFVVFDGYIVPVGSSYKFCLIYQDTGYFPTFDANGTITLKANPQDDE